MTGGSVSRPATDPTSLRRCRTPQTTAITVVHSSGEPFGGQLAADLHALQTNVGHQRTRRGPPGICQFEDLAIELGLLERVLGSALEIASDQSIAEPDAQFTHREFSLARLAAALAKKIPIDGQARLAQRTDRLLKGGVAACIMPRVEIGEAIQHRVVADRVIK